MTIDPLTGIKSIARVSDMATRIENRKKRLEAFKKRISQTYQEKLRYQAPMEHWWGIQQGSWLPGGPPTYPLPWQSAFLEESGQYTIPGKSPYSPLWLSGMGLGRVAVRERRSRPIARGEGYETGDPSGGNIDEDPLPIKPVPKPKPAPTPPPTATAVKKEMQHLKKAADLPAATPTPPIQTNPSVQASEIRSVASAIPPHSQTAFEIMNTYGPAILAFSPSEESLDGMSIGKLTASQSKDYVAAQKVQTAINSITLAMNDPVRKRYLQRMITSMVRDNAVDVGPVSNLKDLLEGNFRATVSTYGDENTICGYNKAVQTARLMQNLLNQIHAYCEERAHEMVDNAAKARLDEVIDLGSLYQRVLTESYNNFSAGIILRSVPKVTTAPTSCTPPTPVSPSIPVISTPDGQCVDPVTGTPSGCPPTVDPVTKTPKCSTGCGVYVPKKKR